MNDTYIDIYLSMFEVLQGFIHQRGIHAHAQQALVKKTHCITQQEEQPVTSNTHAHRRDRILITKVTTTEEQQFPQL
jgi:hypothetical protein